MYRNLVLLTPLITNSADYAYFRPAGKFYAYVQSFQKSHFYPYKKNLNPHLFWNIKNYYLSFSLCILNYIIITSFLFIYFQIRDRFIWCLFSKGPKRSKKVLSGSLFKVHPWVLSGVFLASSLLQIDIFT